MAIEILPSSEALSLLRRGDGWQAPSRAAPFEAVRTLASRAYGPTAPALTWPARQLGIFCSGALTKGLEDSWRWLPSGLIALFLVAALVEPEASATAEAQLSFSEEMLGYGMLAAMSAGFITGTIGVSDRRRWGLVALLPAALIMLTMAVSCPLTGHHAWGLWMAGSFGSAIAATALVLVSLVRTRP